MRRQKSAARSAAVSDLSPSSRITLGTVGLLVLAAAIAYANALRIPFVFDDMSAVVWNPHVRQLWPIGDALGAPPSTPTAGRPLVALSLALNYAVGAMSVTGYHLANLGIHLGCALLLFGVLRRTFGARVLAPSYGGVANGLAFAGALLWLVHPLTSEVVDYVSQRTESMMAFCYLLTLYSVARAATAATGDDAGRPRRWAAAAVVACACGMACKESMVTAPVTAFLFDAVFLAGTFAAAWRARRGLHLALASTWAALAALMLSAPRPESVFVQSALSGAGASGTVGSSTVTYLLAQAGVLVHYLRHVLVPAHLVFDYGPLQPTTVADVRWSIVLVAVLAALTAWAWWRDRRLGFAGVWFFVTLAPVSSVVPIVAEVGAERRMYLPLIALIALAVVGAWHGARWLSRSFDVPAVERALPLLLAIAASVLMVLTIERNAEYSPSSRLWQTVMARRPHGRAIYHLGESLKREGRRDETLTLYRDHYRQYPEARYALAVELDADGRREEAIPHYREYIRERPFDGNALEAENRLGRALAALGRYDEAKTAYEHLLSIVPQNADAHSGLADVLLAHKDYDAAIRLYRESLRLMPTDGSVPPVIVSDVHAGIGLALASLNRAAEAVPEFAQAVRLAPDNPVKQQNLAAALAETGDVAGAVEHYRAAITLAPQSAALHSALGTILLAQGHKEEAMAEFTAAMRIDPNDPMVRMDIAAASEQLGLR